MEALSGYSISQFSSWLGRYGYIPSDESYLESDGGQYIDTGIMPRKGMVVFCRYMPMTQYKVVSYGTYFGTRAVDDSYYNILGRHYGMNTEIFNPWYCNSNPVECLVPVDTGKFNSVYLQPNACVVDGQSYDITTGSQVFLPYSMFVFSANYYGGPARSQPCRIARFTVYASAGMDARLDLVPAQKNGKLCMVDTLTGVYYCNKGSGDFGGRLA